MPLLRDGTVIRRPHIRNQHQINESSDEDLSSLEAAPIERITQVVEGQNTTITFTFKAVDGEETQPSCTPSAGFTILCAEDNLVNQRVLGHMLGKFGQNYVMTENGRDVLGVYKSNPDRFPCIFMDIAMPIMDGREATRRIRAFESTRPGRRRALIVGLTPFPVFSPNVSGLPDDGFDLLMQKPLRLGELYEMFLGGPQTNLVTLYGSLTDEEKRAYPRSLVVEAKLGNDPRSIAIRNEIRRRIEADDRDNRQNRATYFFLKAIVKVVKASEVDHSSRIEDQPRAT